MQDPRDIIFWKLYTMVWFSNKWKSFITLSWANNTVDVTLKIAWLRCMPLTKYCLSILKRSISFDAYFVILDVKNVILGFYLIKVWNQLSKHLWRMVVHTKDAICRFCRSEHFNLLSWGVRTRRCASFSLLEYCVICLVVYWGLCW